MAAWWFVCVVVAVNVIQLASSSQEPACDVCTSLSQLRADVAEVCGGDAPSRPSAGKFGSQGPHYRDFRKTFSKDLPM